MRNLGCHKWFAIAGFFTLCGCGLLSTEESAQRNKPGEVSNKDANKDDKKDPAAASAKKTPLTLSEVSALLSSALTDLGAEQDQSLPAGIDALSLSPADEFGYKQTAEQHCIDLTITESGKSQILTTFCKTLRASDSCRSVAQIKDKSTFARPAKDFKESAISTLKVISAKSKIVDGDWTLFGKDYFVHASAPYLVKSVVSACDIEHEQPTYFNTVSGPVSGSVKVDFALPDDFSYMTKISVRRVPTTDTTDACSDTDEIYNVTPDQVTHQDVSFLFQTEEIATEARYVGCFFFQNRDNEEKYFVRAIDATSKGTVSLGSQKALFNIGLFDKIAPMLLFYMPLTTNSNGNITEPYPPGMPEKAKQECAFRNRGFTCLFAENLTLPEDVSMVVMHHWDKGGNHYLREEEINLGGKGSINYIFEQRLKSEGTNTELGTVAFEVDGDATDSKGGYLNAAGENLPMYDNLAALQELAQYKALRQSQKDRITDQPTAARSRLEAALVFLEEGLSYNFYLPIVWDDTNSGGNMINTGGEDAENVITGTVDFAHYLKRIYEVAGKNAVTVTTTDGGRHENMGDDGNAPAFLLADQSILHDRSFGEIPPWGALGVSYGYLEYQLSNDTSAFVKQDHWQASAAKALGIEVPSAPYVTDVFK